MKTPNQITTIKNHLVSSVIQVFGYSLSITLIQTYSKPVLEKFHGVLRALFMHVVILVM